MARAVHLVGSIPGDSAQQAMEAALRRLGPHLRTLSDGETGPRSWWIRAILTNLYQHPDLELVRDGDFSSYDNLPAWKVREGRALSADSLEPCLVAADAFKSSYPLFQRLRAEHGRPDLDFQVGLPLHVDLAVDAFGQAGFSPAVYEACLEASARQVRAVQAQSDGDVVFQLEMPIPLVAVAGAPEERQPRMAAEMGGRVADLPARTAEGTRFGVHLCLGDMNHKAYGRMRDVRPLVLLANQIAAQWPAGRSLEFVHAPFAAAEEPPTFDPAFYQPLRELDLPAQVRFAAGFIHERVPLERSRELLRLIESLVGRQVDLAAACGLGRRPEVAQAWDAMDKAAALVDA